MHQLAQACMCLLQEGIQYVTQVHQAQCSREGSAIVAHGVA